MDSEILYLSCVEMTRQEKKKKTNMNEHISRVEHRSETHQRQVVGSQVGCFLKDLGFGARSPDDQMGIVFCQG